jgi:integrase
MKFEKIKGPQNHHLFRPIRADGTVSDVFWVRFYRTGKGRLEESLKTNQLGEARTARDKRIADFLGMKIKTSGRVSLVEDKFPEFLELKKGKSKGTFESIRNQWENHLKDYFGGLILDEVTESEWLKYVNKKRVEFPDRKFFNDRKYLSMFLHWLHRSGEISKIPKLPNVDPEIPEGIVYSKEEIQALLKHAGPELQLQILCAYTMGMRIGEILSLEWDQINFQKRTIYLPAHKTKIRKERRFGISATCLDLLIIAKAESKGKAVFPSPEDPDKTVGRQGNKRSWATCKRLAGIPKKYRFHWLRHSFLTDAFKKSVNPALICEYAGLSLEEAQKTYLHFTVEDTRVVSSLVEVTV